MLDYLVPSRTRRTLLHLLWKEDRAGSIKGLAQAADVSFPMARKELNAMRDAGLAVSERRGAALVFRANRDHPAGDTLLALLEEEGSNATAEADDEIWAALADQGAPVMVHFSARSLPRTERSLEALLAEGLRLSHRNGRVAETFPVLLWQNRDALDVKLLTARARDAGETQALGFMLAMTSKLSGDSRFEEWAKDLRDRRFRKRKLFFPDTNSDAARALAEYHSPALAKAWGYAINITEAAFESTFRKFVGDARV